MKRFGDECEDGKETPTTTIPTTITTTRTTTTTPTTTITTPSTTIEDTTETPTTTERVIRQLGTDWKPILWSLLVCLIVFGVLGAFIGYWMGTETGIPFNS